MKTARKPATRHIDVPGSLRLTVRELGLIISVLDGFKGNVALMVSGPQKRIYASALKKLREWETVDQRRRYPFQLFKRSKSP